MTKRTDHHTLWMLAAVAAPAAHFAGCGWLTAALTVLAVLPLTLLPKRWDNLPKSLAVLQLISIGLTMGTLLGGSAVYWPSDNALAVPVTLLILSVLTTKAAAPMAGGLLALCMGLLALPVLFAGAAKVEWSWLRPEVTAWPSGLVLALLLTALPVGKGRKAIVGIGLITAAAAVLIQGTLALPVAEGMKDALYQSARTLGHMETTTAAAMTLGWYAVGTWMLQSGYQIAESGCVGKRMADVLLLGTSAGALPFYVQLCCPKLVILNTVLWVLSPFLHEIINREKSEK